VPASIATNHCSWPNFSTTKVLPCSTKFALPLSGRF
jgi:hypothetical protein